MKYLIALLLCLPVWAATTDAGDVTAARQTIVSSVDGFQNKAIYIKFALPELTNVVSVVLHYNVASFVDEEPVGAMSVGISGAKNLTWDNSSNAATLSALSLTSAGSNSVSATGPQEIDLSALLSGDTLSTDTFTVKFTGPYGSETSAVSATSTGSLGKGCLICDPHVNAHTLEISTDDSEDFAYLEIIEDLPGPCATPLNGVSSPVSQDNWCIGEEYTVSWTYSASGPDHIEVYLVGDVDGPEFLGDADYPDTSLGVTIPAVDPAFGYRVEVVQSCTGYGRAFWSEPFRIVDCSGEGEGEGECEATEIILQPTYEMGMKTGTDYGACYYQFQWPSHVQWSQVDQIGIFGVAYRYGSSSDFTVNALYCAADLTWTEASNAATMNGLSVGSTLGTALIDNTGVTASGSFKTCTLVGDLSGASIVGLPKTLTVKLEDDSGNTTQTAAGITRLSTDIQIPDGGTYIVLHYSCDGYAANTGAAAFF